MNQTIDFATGNDAQSQQLSFKLGRSAGIHDKIHSFRQVRESLEKNLSPFEIALERA